MPVPGIDRGRCLHRNRVAARKGVHAIPVRLRGGLAPPLPADVELAPGDPPTAPPEGGRLVRSVGTLPTSEAQALNAINRILGRAGDRAMAAESVYLLYPEAASSRYISDRYMFLSRRTLQNIASSAEAGFAFMNSHRTGDLSTPSELPYGRTFAGRFESWELRGGERLHRTCLGVYMLRGQAPNGANGPTTDSLYQMIDGGTIFDVSMGLTGGAPICDVCANDMDAIDDETGRYACMHMPGTHYNMTDAEVAAQVDRGVPDGVATYTLDDAAPSEVSAVYDGAVPGAGFRKARAVIFGGGSVPPRYVAEAIHAYREFWNAADVRRLSARVAGRFDRSGAEDSTMALTRAQLAALLSQQVEGDGRTVAEILEDGAGGGGFARAPVGPGPAPGGTPGAFDPNTRNPVHAPAPGTALGTQGMAPAVHAGFQHGSRADSAAADPNAALLAELTNLRQQVATLQQGQAAANQHAALSRWESIEADIIQFVNAERLNGRIIPAGTAADTQALLDAAEVDFQYGPKPDGRTRLANVKASILARAPHGLFGEVLGADALDPTAFSTAPNNVFGNHGPGAVAPTAVPGAGPNGGPGGGAPNVNRVAALLAKIPEGHAAISNGAFARVCAKLGHQPPPSARLNGAAGNGQFGAGSNGGGF